MNAKPEVINEKSETFISRLKQDSASIRHLCGIRRHLHFSSRSP